jgi:hypothetical protein
MVRTYAEYRAHFQDISGTLQVLAADGDATLVSGRVQQTIYIQRVIVYITTDAAQSWVFTDSNGTPRKLCEVTASPGDETRWDFDFGELGMPLTEGKNFLLDVSAAGLAGHIEWYGYMRRSSTQTAATFAAA